MFTILVSGGVGNIGFKNNSTGNKDVLLFVISSPHTSTSPILHVYYAAEYYCDIQVEVTVCAEVRVGCVAATVSVGLPLSLASSSQEMTVGVILTTAIMTSIPVYVEERREKKKGRAKKTFLRMSKTERLAKERGWQRGVHREVETHFYILCRESVLTVRTEEKMVSVTVMNASVQQTLSLPTEPAFTG